MLNVFSDRATAVDLKTYQKAEQTNVICSAAKRLEKEMNKDAILRPELWM